MSENIKPYSRNGKGTVALRDGLIYMVKSWQATSDWANKFETHKAILHHLCDRLFLRYYQLVFEHNLDGYFQGPMQVVVSTECKM